MRSDWLDGVKDAVIINGQTKELYINAARWRDEILVTLTTPETAGHENDMHVKWIAAQRAAPALHEAIVLTKQSSSA